MAALVRGNELSRASRIEMCKPELHITTAHQFPPFGLELPVKDQRKDLDAGLGIVVFDGPQGHGFYKGGHWSDCKHDGLHRGKPALRCHPFERCS
jgi:hypothetical protein